MKSSKKRWIINCIAIVIAAFFLVLPLLDFEEKAQYDIVFLGDSIIGTENVYSIVGITGETLGKTAFNGAFGGSTMSIGEYPIWGSVSGNQWSMIRLAQAMADDDWTSQQTAMSYAVTYQEENKQAFSYFEEKMSILTNIDFNKTQVLVIEHGTNDYNGVRALDNPDDLYDIFTFGGALRSTLKILQEKYPHMQIVLVSPLYCEFPDTEGRSGANMDWGYGVLDDYVYLEQQIAKEFDVAFIDAYHNSGIWVDNAHLYLVDGLHLTDEGMLLVGEYIAAELQKILEK